MYLPMLGLLLVVCEALRNVPSSRGLTVCGVALLAFSGLTYARAQVWSSELALWQQAVEQAPNKTRPRAQLAHTYYTEGQCDAAEREFRKTAELATPDLETLTNWALALDCQGKSDDAIAKLRQALGLERNAHVLSQIGMIQAKTQHYDEAMQTLDEAMKADANFAMTYLYRGNIHEVRGEREAARAEYQHALQLSPQNSSIVEALQRVR